MHPWRPSLSRNRHDLSPSVRFLKGRLLVRCLKQHRLILHALLHQPTSHRLVQPFSLLRKMTASSTVVDTVQPFTSPQTPGSTHTAAEFTEKSTAADVGDKDKDNPVPVSALVSASASVEGATTEYPHGWRLAAIVIAIILAIFLASLDMVRYTPILP